MLRQLCGALNRYIQTGARETPRKERHMADNTTGTLAAFYGLDVTDTQLANRIIAAVYRKDGRKALEQIEIEVENRLSVVLWQLAFDFECGGDTRMATRCRRANEHLIGSN